MAIAHALGGEAKALETTQFVALPPTGRVPAVVLDYGHVVKVIVPRTLMVTEAPNKILARVPDIVAAVKTWMTDRDPQTLSMFGVALAVAEVLEEEFPGGWSADISGGEEPTNVGLSGPRASLAVFPGKVIVRVGSKVHDFLMIKRANIDDNRAKLVDAVRAQIASHGYHLAANARIRAVAQPLADRLAAALQLPAKVSFGGAVTHNSCEKATIAFGTREVTIEFIDSDYRVHAGLTGTNGHDTTLDTLDEALVVATLVHARNTLTIDDLVVGKRYRVLESVGGLVAGTTVTFRGLDDIDNHYGKLEFDHDGTTIGFPGDYSNRHSSTTLSETHRYLELVP